MSIADDGKWRLILGHSIDWNENKSEADNE